MTRKIFLFNVPKHNTDGDVRDYLTDNGVSVPDVYQKSHPDSRKKSFIVVTTERLANRLLQDTFWPEGIRVREFEVRSEK